MFGHLWCRLFGFTYPGFMSLPDSRVYFRWVLSWGGWGVLFPVGIGVVYVGFWGRQSWGRHQSEPRCCAPCGGGGGWGVVCGFVSIVSVASAYFCVNFLGEGSGVSFIP